MDWQCPYGCFLGSMFMYQFCVLAFFTTKPIELGIVYAQQYTILPESKTISDGWIDGYMPTLDERDIERKKAS